MEDSIPHMTANLYVFGEIYITDTVVDKLCMHHMTLSCPHVTH